MMKITHFKTIDSTNTYLKKNCEHLLDLQIISTLHQTNGKGRLGNHWFDNQKSALFSILVKRDLDSSILSLMPLIACVAAHQALIKFTPDLEIKWPNDLVIHDKKLGGILTESVILNHKVIAVIVGFGINVNTIEFPLEINQSATSLALETKKQYAISRLSKKISSNFINELKELSDLSNIINYCNKYSALLNQNISYLENQKIHGGTVLKITDQGCLLVQTASGLKTLNSGEVHLIK